MRGQIRMGATVAGFWVDLKANYLLDNRRRIDQEGAMILTRQTLSDITEWYRRIPDEGGLVLIDKGTDWTSFDIVAKMRGMTRIRKIGHAGTLDSLATGLLIVALGKATRQIDAYQAQAKRYRATVKLGAVTATYDAEAAEESIQPIDHITLSDIEKILPSFVGEIEQVPPMYSAIKQGGKPLYRLARRGEVVDRPARNITITSIDVLAWEPPHLELDIACSKGTYIRSLAHDLGAALGVGGYITSLRRTAIGEFRVDDAITIAELGEAMARVPVE